MHHVDSIAQIKRPRMRVVVSDRLHEVAVIFEKISSQDRPGGGDVVAGVVDQPASDLRVRRHRVACQRMDPQRVDLHDTEILRPIPVIADRSRAAAFYGVDRRQNARRQIVDGCDQCHACKERNGHGIVPGHESCIFYRAITDGESPMTRDMTTDTTASTTACRRNDAGFTLLEILVVIVILGLLIGLVAPAVLRQLGGARVSVAHQSIARLGSVLDMYKLDVGSYPTTDQGLQALVQAPAGVSNWNGPYVQSGQVPVDPWNHPYVYRDPSDRAGRDYDLCSAGPSGDATGGDMICN